MNFPDVKRPPAESVVSSLSSFAENNNKQYTWLGEKTEEGSCFCIQGAFCDVAIELGLKAEFKSNVDSHFYTFSIKEHSSWDSAINIPPIVFWFLGIPQYLSKADLKEVGLLTKVSDDYSRYGENLHDTGIAWSSLNDNTTLDLKALVSLAKYLIKKNATTE